MDQIQFEGQTYYRSGKMWADSRNIVVCDELQNELNAAFIQTLDLQKFTTWDLIRLADQCKVSASVFTAIQLYERILSSNDPTDFKVVLPRLTSCYRIQGQPKKAIELAISASKRFGSNILEPITLTSVAAAYCDLEDWNRAKKCADRAYAKCSGKAAPELRSVYERIRLNTEGKRKR